MPSSPNLLATLYSTVATLAQMFLPVCRPGHISRLAIFQKVVAAGKGKGVVKVTANNPPIGAGRAGNTWLDNQDLEAEVRCRLTSSSLGCEKWDTQQAGLLSLSGQFLRSGVLLPCMQDGCLKRHITRIDAEHPAIASVEYDGPKRAWASSLVRAPWLACAYLTPCAFDCVHHLTACKSSDRMRI